MKNLFVAALFAMSSVAVPTVWIATPSVAATCGENVPAEWKRPGGYCDQIESQESLSESVESRVYHCGYLWDLVQSLPVGEEILVAC